MTDPNDQLFRPSGKSPHLGASDEQSGTTVPGDDNPYRIDTSSAEPIEAEIVTDWPTAPRDESPRIWPTLAVAIFIIPTAIIVAGAAMLLALGVTILADVYSGGPATVPLDDGQAMQNWVRDWLFDFPLTRIGVLVVIIPGQLVFLAAALAGAWLSPHPLTQRLGLVAGILPRWTWPVFVFATPAVAFATSHLLTQYGEETSEELELLNDMLTIHTGPFMIVVILLVSVLPGFAEEMVFRGYVQRRLIEWGRHWFGKSYWSSRATPPRRPIKSPVVDVNVPIGVICLTSMLFAVAHIGTGLLHVVAVIPLGLWLGILAWRCDSIWPSVLCHIANNMIAVVGLQFAEETHDANEASASGELIANALLAVSVVAFLISIVLLINGGRKPGDEGTRSDERTRR